MRTAKSIVLPRNTYSQSREPIGDLGDFSQGRDFASKYSRCSIYSRRMQAREQKKILDAFFIVLRPIARILLRYGIGFREFAEVSKAAFVDVATKDYGIRGRPTNISRVAVMTGLTRKEVRRVRDQLTDNATEYSVKTTPLAHILYKWHSVADFLDADGQPLKLPFAGEGVTFSELVRRYGGDIPPGAMRTELRRVGAVDEDENGELTVTRRDVIPHVPLDKLRMMLLHGAYPLLSNIVKNSDPESDDAGWAQVTAFSGDIPNQDLKRLRRICKDRSKTTMTAFDDLLMAFERQEDAPDSVGGDRPVAVGIFYFEEHDQESYSIWS